MRSKWPGRILLVVVLVAVGYALGRNLESLTAQDFQLRGHVLVLSLLCATLSHLLHFANWLFITRRLDIRRGVMASGKAYFVSRLGRYIPGKVTLLMMRFNEYKMYSRRAVIMAIGVDYVSSLAAAGFVVLIGVFSARGLIPEYIRYSSLVSTGVFLLALYPPILKRLSNILSALAKRPPLDVIPSYPQMLAFVAVKIIAALIQGMSFFLILRGLASVDMSYYLVTTGVYYAAGLIGIAALFAPQGIGVTEGVLYLVLPTFLPKPAVFVGALAIRLVLSVTELLLAVIFAIIDKLSPLSDAPVPSAASGVESERDIHQSQEVL